MRYVWRTPIGTWEIRANHEYGRWELWWNETCFGSQRGLRAAASHIHSQMTGNPAWDTQEVLAALRSLRQRNAWPPLSITSPDLA